jgi:hypothetical protein
MSGVERLRGKKDKPESVQKILREYRRDMRKCDKRALPQPTTEYVRILLKRVEHACKRAYSEIDKAVCFIDGADSSDIDDVRRAMENTIGEYYE